jgi:hypothetical protein
MSERRKKAIMTAWIFIAITLLGISGQAPAWKGSIDTENGITVVRNPKTPLDDGKIPTLIKELGFGGAGASGDSVIASAKTLAVDDGENIYVLDEKDFAVKVFDKNGAFVRRFGQKGKGPGDLDKPTRISIDRSKNALVIVNGASGLSYFSFNGKFLKSFTAGEANSAEYARADSAGRIILNSVRSQDVDHRWDVLSKFETESGPPVEVKKTALGSPYDFLMPLVYWDIDEKGLVYYGYPKAYEIEIIGPQNQVVKKILKDYDPVEPGVEVKAQIDQTMKLMTPSLAAKAFVSKYHSAFINFLIDERGRLFVANWAKRGKDSIYDVFDSEGRYVACFPLPFRPVVFKKSKLYCIEEDADGYQAVTRYSVNWLK